MSITIAVNAGSSSLKFKLFEMPEENVLGSGVIERIGLDDSIVTIKAKGNKFEETTNLENHEKAIQYMLDKLIELGIISKFEDITAAGHRVVTGGETLTESAVVTDEVMEKIEEAAELAPLHNPANITGIRAVQAILPDALNVAVFDTSFHSKMPAENYVYAIPYKYYEDYSVRRYGAHGTSHQYVSERAADLLGKDLEDLKVITCHLGNGASISAVQGGHSIDTSMGFTPLAGVMMGTRSGDVDPSTLPFIMEKEGLSDINDMIEILNKESGLLGVSGVSSDMRDVEDAAAKGNERAQLALDIYYNRVVKYIGAYAALMNGVDAIVFTAGVGENSKETRQIIADKISFLGVEMDEEKNDVRGEERIISTDASDVSLLLIPTDEELMIARDTERLK